MIKANPRPTPGTVNSTHRAGKGSAGPKIPPWRAAITNFYKRQRGFAPDKTKYSLDKYHHYRTIIQNPRRHAPMVTFV